MSKINLINSGVSRAVDTLVTANIRDSLDGELVLSFTLHSADVAYVNDTTTVQHNGQYYNIISYDKGVNGQCPECPVECEHVSYVLNDAQYSLDNFAATGTPAQLLAAALNGTPFSAGIVVPTTSKTVIVNDTASRRAVLYAVAAAVGGEIEYNGYSINLRTHRGSVPYIELLDTDNVTDVSVSHNKRDGTTSYSVVLGRKTTLSAGDNVHIVFTPLSINVNTRIIAVDYNPYNPFEVSIEVGDYVPDIVDTYSSLTTEIKSVRHDFTVADGVFTSRITTDEGNISTLQQTATSFEVRISSTESRITTLDSNLETRIGTYVDGAAGTAKIVLACSATYQTKSAMSGYASDADLANYVLTTSLNASMGAYIDGATGKAKVILACSGTYTTTSATATITSAVDVAEANIALVVGSTRLVGTTGTVNASLIISTINGGTATINTARINLVGYITATNLLTSGQSILNGDNITTGTLSAARIGANNGGSISFGSPILLDTRYRDIAGIENLYFGPYGKISCAGLSTNNLVLKAYSAVEIMDNTGDHGQLNVKKIYHDGNISIDAYYDTYGYSIFIGTNSSYAQTVTIGSNNATVNFVGDVNINGYVPLTASSISSYVVFQ